MILLFWLIGILLIALAIPLAKRKIAPNSWYGLRTSETMGSKEVWYEANARSAIDLINLGGGLIIVSSALFFVPWRDPEHYVIVCALLFSVAAFYYAIRGIRIGKKVEQELRTRDDV